MTVYVVVLNEMLTSVIASQVVAPARSHAAAFPTLSFHVLFLEPARVALGRAARHRLKRLRALWPEGRMSLVPYVGRLGRFSPAWSLRARLLATGAEGPSVFHCRGPEATLQAARMGERGARIVFGARGASDHETRLRLGLTAAPDATAIERSAERCLAMERAAVDSASAVTAVSAALADRYRCWTRGTGKPVTVIPCCVERPTFSAAARSDCRRRLGLGPDDLLLVHVSSEARWEAFDEVIRFFRAVSHRRPARLLFLTTLPAEVVTASVSPDDPIRGVLTVTRAPEGAVRHYLSAADIGLLLRRPHEAFRASSPIKFAEYLSAGLAVVVSEGVGTLSQTVTEQRMGIVLSSGADATSIDVAAHQLLELMGGEGTDVRARAIAACEEKYVWSRYGSAIADLYGLPQRTLPEWGAAPSSVVDVR